jgi:YbbR domain-containing protein
MNKPKYPLRTRLLFILLAIIIWLFVVTGKEYEMVFDLPIKIENLKPGKVVISELPSQAQVRLKGSGRSLIFLVLFANGEVKLDLTTINHSYDFHLTPKMVKLPSALNTSVVEILKPETITIELDEIVFKELPVRLKVEVALKPGYILCDKIQSEPSTVRIEGPLSYVRTLRFIETEKLTLPDLHNDLSKKIPLKSPDEHIKFFPQKVTAKIAVDKIVESVFEGIPIVIKGLPDDLEAQFDPPTIDVTVRGASGQIKNLDKNRISASVFYHTDSLKSGTKIAPQILISANVDLLKIEPDSVRVSLHRK